MGRTKRKTQPSPTSSVNDSDYVPDEEVELEEATDAYVEEQVGEEEIEEENEEEEEENVEEEEEAEEEEDELEYDPHRFVGREAQDSYDSYWSKRSVLCERGINLHHFKEEPADFKTLMTTRGWSTAVMFRATADPTLIREFYTNANLVESQKSGEVHVESMVRGKQITIRRRHIRATLDIPKVNNPGYPYPADQEPPLSVLARHLSEGETRSWGVRRQFPKNKLSGNFRILHELICSQILPVSNDDFVSPDRARLMYALTTGVSIDLATLMMKALSVPVQQIRGPHSLIFAGLIMKMLEKCHVPIDDKFRIVRPLVILSSSTCARSLAQTQHRGTSVATSSTPPARPPVMATVHSDIQALGARLSVIEEEQRAQRSILEEILSAVRPPPPPPPSDPEPFVSPEAE